MYCPKCNEKLDVKLRFCPFCGYEFSAEENVEEDNKNLQEDNKKDAGKKDYTWLLVAGLAIISCPAYKMDMEKFLYILGGVLILTLTILLCMKIKNIVLNVGRKLLDFTTALDVIIAIVIVVVGFFTNENNINLDSDNNFYLYVIGGIVYILIALLKDYILYLLIDIRDSLKQIADKNKMD